MLFIFEFSRYIDGSLFTPSSRQFPKVTFYIEYVSCSRKNSYKRSLYPRATAKRAVALALGARLSSRPYFTDTVAMLPAYLSPDPGVFELWTGVVLDLRPTSGEKVVSIGRVMAAKITNYMLHITWDIQTWVWAFTDSDLTVPAWYAQNQRRNLRRTEYSMNGEYLRSR